VGVAARAWREPQDRSKALADHPSAPGMIPTPTLTPTLPFSRGGGLRSRIRVIATTCATAPLRRGADGGDADAAEGAHVP
jgi:hypothetical protein